jgi:glycosyltransferase involved in cell wall biosynthesis
MVVPLQVGGGSRLKILEALATGLPVVSTSVGAEGLRLQAGRDLVVGDTPEELARSLLDSMRDPELAKSQADRGRRIVLQEYDWDVLADRLEQAWVSCAALAGNDPSGKMTPS